MFLSLLAHAILRAVVGALFLLLGIRHLKHHVTVRELMALRWPRLAGFFVWYIAFVELVLGAMFLLGFFTQIAALLGILLATKMLFLRRTLPYPTFPQPLFYLLLIGVCVSLFITGAGAFAFDLPI